MPELILILAVALLVLPLIDILSMVPNDVIQARVRTTKIIVIAVTLVVLIFVSGSGELLFPHTHGGVH